MSSEASHRKVAAKHIFIFNRSSLFQGVWGVANSNQGRQSYANQPDNIWIAWSQ